jgi:hypothetical protein
LPRSPVLLVGLLVIVCICIAAGLLFNRGGDGGDTGGLFQQDPGLGLPEATQEAFVEPATPRPFTPPPAATGEGQTWLVMLYQDADDKVLEQDIFVDLNEAERIGSTDRVHVVTQLDRFRGGYPGDGDWTSTRRYYITQDNDLTRINSQLVEDLGEVNMADGATLVDFATWAIETFPADRHVLILSDHGMGWPGGWSDPAPGGSGDPSIPLSSALGEYLYLNELDSALQEIRARTGLEKFEMVGMDACLMSHLEVFSALAPHASYAVASQETEPALGWAYTAFLEELVANPDMSGADLGEQIVASYIEEDQRIVDDQARAEFAGRGFTFGAPSPEQLTQQLSKGITLSAADLSALPDLMNRVNDLAYHLQSVNPKAIAEARSYAQSFTSIFGQDVPPSYIDLGNFVQLLAQVSNDQGLSQAADRVMQALQSTVIAEKHGPSKRGATGVSVYFPNSRLYASPAAGAESYTAVADRFARESLWDDFLAFHYTGRSFEPAAAVPVVPGRGETITAPGAGAIQVSGLTLSAPEAAPGSPITISADIGGENIGYIKLFVGYLDPASNSIYVADTDYLESAETREVDGVFYPDWGQGEFTLEFEWEPIVFAVSDGTEMAEAVFNPESYGAIPEEAVYIVDGIYTYTDGTTRQARAHFVNGAFTQVFGFMNEDGTGAPREIIPNAGDRFTVLEKWLDLAQDGRVVNTTYQEGETVTFGNQPLTWEVLDAAPGEYVVGFIVEDLDGNAQAAYEQVTVR